MRGSYLKPATAKGAQMPLGGYTAYSVLMSNAQGIKMTTLYRIQNKDGKGMYATSAASSVGMTSGYSPRHPSPRDDSKLMEMMLVRFSNTDIHGRLFAFGSLEQLKMWVYQDHWRQGLHDLGFYVLVITIPDNCCAVGDTQAVFEPEHVAAKSELNLMEI